MRTESAALKAGNGRGAVINDNMREELSEWKGEQPEVEAAESASSTAADR